MKKSTKLPRTIVLRKPDGQKYIFHYDGEHLSAFIGELVALAMDYDLNLTWVDIVYVAGGISGGLDVLLMFIGQMAADPDCVFTWYNAAQVSQLIRKFREQASA